MPGPACFEAGLGRGLSSFPSQPGCACLAQIHESSPLDLASEEPERLPCLQRLLDLGADVNAADKHGGCLLQESRTAGPPGKHWGDTQGAPGQQLGGLTGCWPWLVAQHGWAHRDSADLLSSEALETVQSLSPCWPSRAFHRKK